MSLFGFGKKGSVIDLAEKYKRQKEMQAANSTDSVDAVVNSMGSTQTANTGSSTNTQIFGVDDSAQDKRKKLAKRILDMANKIDDMSNKMFLLQQRIELLEKKIGIGSSSE